MATLLAIFLILATSLDLLVGYTGLLSLAHAVFFGIGAYASALLTTQLGWPPFLAILIGMLAAALVSAIIALPSIRVHDIYLLIITIAVQIVFTTVLLNWTSVTGGPAGVPRIPRLSVFGYPLSGYSFLVFAVMSMAIWLYLFWILVRTPFGRLLQAVRDDETGCRVLGKNVAATKIVIFAFSATAAAFAGSLYAHYASYVDPTGFDINVSILILLMVMLGGAGTLKGPVFGTVILMLLPEALKFTPLPTGVAAPAQQLLYGVLLVLVVYFRPQGLFGKSRRTAVATAH
ncbi:MAG: branched-chain amino acid ABC transporter permease [Aquisalimonadaceae bacterium]